MAHSSMVAYELTPSLVDAGRALITALDDGNVPVTAAFWLLAEPDSSWRLFIASPEVDELGIRAFYRKLLSLVHEVADAELNSSLVSAVSPDDRMVELIGSAIRTGRALESIRLTRNVFKGEYVPDTLIYRVL
jgi:hypothetical protein